MPRTLTLAVLLAAYALPAHAGEHLRLATGEWPPYAGAALPHGGVAEHIIAAAFQEEGVDVAFERLSWKRGYEMARQGKLDGAILWAPPERADPDFLGTEPVMYSRVVLFHRKATPLTGASDAALQNYRFAYPDGYSYENVPAYRELYRHNPHPPMAIASDEQGLMGLVNERLDVYPADKLVGYYLLSSATHGNWAATVTFQPKPISNEPLVVLLSRRTAHTAALAQRFNTGLAKLRAQGLVDKWLGDVEAGAAPRP